MNPLNTDTPPLPLGPESVDKWMNLLFRRDTLIEVVAALVALALAWFVVYMSRGRRKIRAGSVLYGEHMIDGVLFPALAWLWALVAQYFLKASMTTLVVFKVLLPVLLSLVLIRMAAKVLSAAFPKRAWVVSVEKTVSWLAWGGVVLWLTDLLPRLMKEMESVTWQFGESHMSLRNVVEGSLTGGIVMVLALWMSAAIERRLLDGPADEMSLRKIAANLVRVVLVFLGLLMAMSSVGINLTTLSVLGGGLGVGLGFGLQKVAANYVSGFVILAEGSLHIGDVVKVDGFEGKITDIATRYTVIRSVNGRESIVPNEMLISQRIENSSLADPNVQFTTMVQVAYGTDLPALFPALIVAVSRVPRVLKDPSPSIGLSSFAADGLELTIAFWINDPERGISGVRSDVNMAILKELNRRGVEIPFPQRVVRQC